MPTTSNFGWTTPADTDLVKDGAAAIRTLGNGIDTSFLDLKGGTTDQVLAKNSNTDLDFKWVAQDDADAIQKSLIDAEGDLIVGDAADAVQRLAIGSNGNVLTVDTSVDGKIKWAAPAAGGKVLQVVNAVYSVQTASTSATYADTGLSLSITPSSATSKVLVFVSQTGLGRNGADNFGLFKLMRGATDLVDPFESRGGQVGGNTAAVGVGGSSVTYLDSPATTSSTTYKTQFKSSGGATDVFCQTAGSRSTITLMEIGA